MIQLFDRLKLYPKYSTKIYAQMAMLHCVWIISCPNMCTMKISLCHVKTELSVAKITAVNTRLIGRCFIIHKQNLKRIQQLISKSFLQPSKCLRKSLPTVDSNFPVLCPLRTIAIEVSAQRIHLYSKAKL